METANRQNPAEDDKLFKVESSVIVPHILQIPFSDIDSHLDDLLLAQVKMDIEGRCTKDGYVLPNTIKLISKSMGEQKGEYVRFNTVFEYKVYLPAPGNKLKCIVRTKNETMGISADIANMSPSPAKVFILRDTEENNPRFQELKKGDTFVAIVVGQRFEVRNETISIFGVVE